jgi:hypothetical protein
MNQSQTKFKDITHKSGKVYRIIAEDVNVAHPCECIAVIFDISLPGYPRNLHTEKGLPNDTIDTVMRKAETYVQCIP